MSSLIASFFRKNVTLNMKVTEEGLPQTVRSGDGVSATVTKEVASEGVWNLPRGESTPLVPKGEPFKDNVYGMYVNPEDWKINIPEGDSTSASYKGKSSKSDERPKKNSLIADFFRRTVTLNKGATDESAPQTVYQEPKNTIQEWMSSLYRNYYSDLIWSDDRRYSYYNKPYAQSISIELMNGRKLEIPYRIIMDKNDTELTVWAASMFPDLPVDYLFDIMKRIKQYVKGE